MTAAVHDPVLPALDRLTDRAELAGLLDTVAWLEDPRGVEAELRLRWKPGTSLRVGALVPTTTGPVAVLILALPAAAGAKADKLAASAARRGYPVHREGPVVVVPAAADPVLRRLIPGQGVPLSYNPARRWVGRAGDHVIKVHAAAPPTGVAALLRDPPPALTPHLPAAQIHRGGRLVHTTWIDGTAPRPGHLPAIRAALHVLHTSPPPAGLPALDYTAVLRAAHNAGRATAIAIPAERARITALLATLARVCGAGAWPDPDTLVHGDFSPDQVVLADGRAVLLDLDRAAIGPAGWDSAHWTVAQTATGAGPVLLAPGEASATLLLAAALLRAPEPFRRLRHGWAARTRALLDLADTAARQAS